MTASHEASRSVTPAASRQPTPTGSDRGVPRVPAEGLDTVLEQTIGYRYAASAGIRRCGASSALTDGRIRRACVYGWLARPLREIRRPCLQMP